MANVYNRVSGLFLTLKMFLHQVFKLKIVAEEMSTMN